MKTSVILRIIGVMLIGYSFSLIPPIGVAIYYQESFREFGITALLMLLPGLLLTVANRKANAELSIRHGFIIVALFWFVLGVVSSLPFYFYQPLQLTFAQAAFEAVSGVTTTGATLITQLEKLPRSILYYRAQLQFLGGMGIIVLAVAIMPLLGMGGTALYRAEIPGPMKDEKLRPRIAQTARVLWLIYLGLISLCALCYGLAGMSPFDAITHAFSTIATGGFSNYDNSFAHFRSDTLEWIAVFFMMMGGINFSLHFLAFSRRDVRLYFRNPETAAFLTYCVGFTAVVTVCLLATRHMAFYDSFRNATFHVLSIITTTGFALQDISAWPLFLPLLFILISYIGGTAGSTSGGIKVIRIMLLVKQAKREILQMIHPRAVLPICIGDHSVDERLSNAVWGFFALYIFSTAALTLLLSATGMDNGVAFSAVAACLNVTGPVVGELSTALLEMNSGSCWVLTFTMLLGRLEIFTLFALLTPAFWRL